MIDSSPITVVTGVTCSSGRGKEQRETATAQPASRHRLASGIPPLNLIQDGPGRSGVQTTPRDSGIRPAGR